MVHLVSQDLSVAGKRKGLQHSALGNEETTRSGLFMEQIRIIKEMRNVSSDNNRGMAKPRFMVWENVYGAFSSNKGEDFRAVLEEIVRIKDKDAHIPGPPKDGWPHAGYIMGDGYSVAWRGHDAQYWGVPQRRKRVCVLADFDGGAAPKILFETELWRETDEGNPNKAVSGVGEKSRPEVQPITEGVSGDTQQSGTERQSVAGDIEDSVGTSSYTLKVRGGVEFDSKGRRAGKGALVQEELSGTLGVSQDQTLITGCLNPWDVQSKHIQTEDGVAESLYSGECRYGGGESYVMQSANSEGTITAFAQNQRDEIRDLGDKAGAVSAEGGMHQQTFLCVENQPILLESNQNHATIQTEGVSTTLPAAMGEGGGYVPMIAYGISAYDSNAMKSPNPNSGIYEADTTRTLDLNGGNPACNQGGMAVVYKENKAYGLDRASFNQGQNAQFGFSVIEEQSPTITAKGPGGVCIGEQ